MGAALGVMGFASVVVALGWSLAVTGAGATVADDWGALEPDASAIFGRVKTGSDAVGAARSVFLDDDFAAAFDGFVGFGVELDGAAAFTFVVSEAVSTLAACVLLEDF